MNNQQNEKQGFKFDLKDTKTRLMLMAAICLVVIIIAALSSAKEATADPSGGEYGEISIIDADSSQDTSAPDSKNDRPAQNVSMELHVLDVGQGDGAYVKCGKKNIVIDAGENGYDDFVCNYLKNQGVETIDLVIATHQHSDHIGGLDSVVKTFDCKAFMMPEVPESMIPNSVAYEKFLKAIDRKKVTYFQPVTGDIYDFDGVKMYILDDGRGGEDLNSSSIIVKFVCGNNSFLLMADAEKSEENRIMARGTDVKADVLKMGHHGSSKATSQKFLDAVNPKYCAISCGANNDYGFPHREIKAMLREKGIKYFRTDLVSTIVFKSDGKNITVTTAR